MGTRYDYRCKECPCREFITFYDKSLTIGTGMRPYEEMKSKLHWRFKKQLQSLEEKHGITTAKEFDSNLYTCPKCNTIHSRFWLKAKINGKVLFETSFHCPKCKTKLEYVDKDSFNIKNYACEKCGRYDLEITGICLYD